MKASTEVGDIVLLPYTNFKGEKSNVLFLIIHHERYIDGDHNLNFTGVKISSREYKYSIALSAQHVPALDHDSFININQQHRFTEKQVIRVLGKLNTPSMRIVLLQMKRYFDAIWQQVSYKCHDVHTPKVASPKRIDSNYYSEYIKTGVLPQDKELSI
jgi:hypothetical protein